MVEVGKMENTKAPNRIGETVLTFLESSRNMMVSYKNDIDLDIESLNRSVGNLFIHVSTPTHTSLCTLNESDFPGPGTMEICTFHPASPVVFAEVNSVGVTYHDHFLDATFTLLNIEADKTKKITYPEALAEVMNMVNIIRERELEFHCIHRAVS